MLDSSNLSKMEKKWLIKQLVELHTFCKENDINYVSITGYPYEGYIDITYTTPDDSSFKSVTLFKDDIRKVKVKDESRTN